MLAPLVGEFLLGNQPITAIAGLFVLAPMYGGGAILVRESARRAGRGWPTIIVLGAAYSIVEEALIDQMLFNPGYLGLHSFDGMSPIPGVGISASLLQGTLTLHAIWSISVPIAMVEAFDPRPEQPWLRLPGLTVTALVFLAGSLLLAIYQAIDLDFVASPAEWIGSVIAVAGLVWTAFRLPAPVSSTDARPTVAPWVVGVTTFALTGSYWLEAVVQPDGGTADWVGVGLWFVLVAVSFAVLRGWSRRPGWGRAHRLAAAGGALMTYAWAGYVQSSQLGDRTRAVGVVGTLVFGLGAVVLLVAAVRSVRARSAWSGHPAG